MSDLYEILPLKWERKFDAAEQRYEACTPFGSYTVKRHRSGFGETGPWQYWTWGYCFAEYYDELESQCDDAKMGKSFASSNWMARITQALKLKS